MNVETALRKLARHHPPEERKLVAVSGGRDSVVLLHALHAAGHTRLVVCHLNHRLRGRASGGDVAFVRRLAARLGYECEAGSVDVARLARQDGESLETAGRGARHRFLNECAGRHGCHTVLMAHHAGDQAETVLFNLLRGSSGLRGIPETGEIHVLGAPRPLRVVRPLLAVPRAEIDRYAAARAINYREDASNATTGPARNRLRLELLPAIDAAMGREVRPLLCRAAELAACEDDFLDSLAAPYAAIEEPDTRELFRLHPALQRRVIHLWLKARGFTGIGCHEVEAVRGMLDLASGPAKVNLPGNRFVRRTKAKLRALP